jgi:hypothetical protein
MNKPIKKAIFAGAILSFISILLAILPPTFCQQSNQTVPKMLFSSAHTNASCELAAGFTELDLWLKYTPDATGYIVIYNGPNDPPGLFHRYSLGARNVLVNEKQITPNRIIILNGGSRESFLAEYWFVPKDAHPPKAGPLWKPELQQVEIGKFDEFIWDPGVEDLYEFRRATTQLDGFAQALIKNPDAVGYIIGYADGERVTHAYLETRNGKEKVIKRTFKMTGKKVAGWARNSLVEQKLNPTRIVRVDGGYRETETVELWVVPAGQKAPKPTPSIKR